MAELSDLPTGTLIDPPISSKYDWATTVDDGKPCEICKDWWAEPYPSPYAMHSEAPPLRDNQCPHCERDWHSGPLTARVAAMWESHDWDEGYDADADETVAVCPGSDVYGPARPREKTSYIGNTQYLSNELVGGKSPAWLQLTYSVTNEYIAQGLEWPKWEIKEPASFDIKTWFPDSPEVKAELEAKNIEFGPISDDFPAPKPPGYDFTKYSIDDGNNKKYTNKRYKKGKK